MNEYVENPKWTAFGALLVILFATLVMYQPEPDELTKPCTYMLLAPGNVSRVRTIWKHERDCCQPAPAGWESASYYSRGVQNRCTSHPTGEIP